MTNSSSPVIIVACTRDFAIGRGGDLLYHISDDLKRFKTLTMGHPIIMGRRTFESFPKGALPGRRNIVVTRNKDYTAPDIETAPSIEAALEFCSSSEPYPFVIGGGEIYAQAFPLTRRIELTLIDAHVYDADTVFPQIDPAEWILADGRPFDQSAVDFRHTDQRSGVAYAFLSLVKKS